MLDIYAGANGAALAVGRQFVWASWLSWTEAGAEDLKQAVSSAGHARSRARLWLSGSVCRPWRYERAQGQSSIREGLEIGLVQASRQTGLDRGHCRVWIGDAASALRGLSLAVDERLLMSIERAVPRIERVAPWWGEVAASWLVQHDRAAGLAVVDTDAVTAVILGEPKARPWTLSLPGVGDGPAARAALARALAARGQETPRDIEWFVLGDDRSGRAWLRSLPFLGLGWSWGGGGAST